MKKLKTIDLCGIVYKVKYYPNIASKKKRKVEEAILGFIDNDKREIHLEEGRRDIEYILFHELVHGAIEAIMADPNTKTFDKYYGEEFVRPFARLLWSMVKNSGLLRSGL